MAHSLVEHVSDDASARASNAECSRRWHAKVVHSFTADELPDGGPHDRPSICHARVWGLASPLELQLPLLAIPSLYFS